MLKKQKCYSKKNKAFIKEKDKLQKRISHIKNSKETSRYSKSMKNLQAERKEDKNRKATENIHWL